MAWIPSVSQHLMFSALALLVYILSTRVEQLRRPPTSAIAWVMGLALIPYLLLPLFLLFGQRKLKAARRSLPVRAYVERHWAEALIETFNVPAPAAAKVRFHADGSSARQALWEIIEGAQHRLDLCTFLVADDALGRELIERLTRRAREGIRIRLMIDAAGEWLTSSPSLEALRAAGGQVAYFNPVLALRRKVPRNLRNHRKLTVADDHWLWSGGRNFASEYFCGEPNAAPAWIDLSFDLRGPVAAAAAKQFELDWIAGQGGPARIVPSPDTVAAEDRAQFLPSGPDQSEDTVCALLLAACFHSKHRLLAVTPYFVPDDSLLTALRLAALRGVQITLVLPYRSNHRLADFVRGRALRALALAGAKVVLVPEMVHAKAVVVDSDLAWSGSINLDARSLLINYEAIVVFYGVTQIEWLARWIESLAAQGEFFVARRPALGRDIAEGLLLTVAFQL